ncbi:hypothetical protein Pan265_18160 [Mucisphaera calidilacus]|uniref:Uncharacterized protein n=2 Tax=Mucisphaera calidilacus TaxID=2527982 RepID=A0A518BYA6_9BACT|nr:hypothetical protein Pan265_18160 [Mucisphaera calidilacus]
MLIVVLSGCSSPEPVETEVAADRPVVTLPLAVDYVSLMQTWPETTHLYPSGDVRHPSNYFDEVPHFESDPTFEATLESALLVAMSGDRASNWSGENVGGAAAEPFAFLYDVVAMPVRVFIDPPWELGVSPESPE